MFTAVFWKDLTERALKTFVQAFVACLTVGVPIYQLDLVEAAGMALTATVASVLTSLASAPSGVKGTASLVDTTPMVNQVQTPVAGAEYTGQHARE